MHIQITYESSWRNSFLDPDTSNNEKISKNGRKYTSSITQLKKPENYIKREITLDTVMGILNRLIGDQRKLYQARKSKNYYFSSLEKKITFKDDFKQQWQEMVYLRNISGNEDRNSFTGAICSNNPIFNSEYSSEFWGILNLEIHELPNVILHNKRVHCDIDLNPISIIVTLEKINKMQAIEIGELQPLVDYYHNLFGNDISYVNNKGLLNPISLYCSALYAQLFNLEKKYDISTARTKSGAISGISKRGFTKKNFMEKYTTGDKKKIWGNPYINETFIKGEGKQRNLLNKSRGNLFITIDIPREEAKNLKNTIQNAAVSAFYLGKKGLAYVTDIDTREVTK
jgi:hypothetical protein